MSKRTAPESLIEKYKAIQKIGTTVQVPFWASRFLGVKQLDVVGDQMSIGNDSDWGTLQECRVALTWLIGELGGDVKWQQ